jgi:hypothetical protein
LEKVAWSFVHLPIFQISGYRFGPTSGLTTIRSDWIGLAGGHCYRITAFHADALAASPCVARLPQKACCSRFPLSLSGGVLASGVTIGVVRLLKTIGGHAIPRLDSVQIGWPVLLTSA